MYHTAIVVGGLEYFFGSGVNVAPAGRTPLGQPMQVLELGCACFCFCGCCAASLPFLCLLELPPPATLICALAHPPLAPCPISPPLQPNPDPKRRAGRAAR